MEKQQLDLLLRNHNTTSAEQLRAKVSFIQLSFFGCGSLIYIVSYILTGNYALIPYVLLPFTLPCMIFYYYMKKTGSYAVTVAMVFVFDTTLGLMHLTAEPAYLVDLFLIPTFIGGAFLMLKYHHAVLFITYLLVLYLVTSAIVYYWAPFEVVYTNDNYVSIAIGFVLSVAVSGVMYYSFAKRYQQNSDLLSNAVLALSKINDDNKLLINVVSHDFRNAIFRVMLHLENTRTVCKEPAQLQGLEDIESALMKMSDLLKEVQQVRELFDDEDGPMLAEVSFAEIVKKLELVFRLQMYQKKLEFEVQADGGATLRINTDVFIHIILANLIGNAIKFSPPGGRIVLKLEKNGTDRCLTISNLAIDDQLPNLNKLASGKERVESAPGTNNEKGQGLGISIVKRFCRTYDITHALSVDAMPDGKLWQVNTRLKFR